MDQEQNQMQSAPQLCANGCGFYGSPNFDGLCSKCHKDVAKSQQASKAESEPVPAATAASGGSPSAAAAAAAAAAADLSQVLQETSALLAATAGQPTVTVLPPAAAATTPATAETQPPAESVPQPAEEAAPCDPAAAAIIAEGPAASPADASGKKKKSRCEVCRKKVGLTGFTCRCDGLFCSLHRYSDKHECSFDYRVLGQQEIRKNNPVIVGEKVNKI